MSFPCTTISTAHTIMDSEKIIPPPRSTMVECYDRSFGLSMMLKWSAILKYTSSAINKIAAIITYVQIIFLNIILPIKTVCLRQT